MVYAADSKSAVGDHMGVRVPLPAPCILLTYSTEASDISESVVGSFGPRSAYKDN